MRYTLLFLSLTVLSVFSRPAMADETLIMNTYDLGWYKNTGQHDAYNVNTTTGSYYSDTEYRSFFLWNVPDLEGVIYEASFEVHLQYSLGATSPQTGLMYDIGDIDPSVLVSSHGSGSAEGMEIFSRLGAGVTYGDISLTGSEDKEAILVYELNANAIEDIDAAKGGIFGIGIRNTTGRGTFLFSSGSRRGVQNLVLRTTLAPTANFAWSATNLSVEVTDESTDSDGSIVEWIWDFGDGAMGSGQNSSHTYSAAGAYNVILTVTDDKGVTDSMSMPVDVSAPNEPPAVGFTTSVVDLSVEFTDTSTDSDGTIVSWEWDFGDGGTSTEQDPGHTYAASGIYEVMLTVTDDRGATDMMSMPVDVSAGNVPPSNEPPAAGFTTSVVDLSVEFTDTSTDSDGTIVSWEWDFGDGSTSTEQDPGHTYAASGIYEVMLTVTDDGGGFRSVTKAIEVTAAQPPDRSGCDAGGKEHPPYSALAVLFCLFMLRRRKRA